MEYKITVFDEALEHLRQIGSYITTALNAPQAADDVLADLWGAILSLRTFPERIPFSRESRWKKRGLHCMVVRKYLIYFQIDEKKHHVNVVAVIYGRRDQAARLSEVVFP